MIKYNKIRRTLGKINYIESNNNIVFITKKKQTIYETMCHMGSSSLTLRLSLWLMFSNRRWWFWTIIIVLWLVIVGWIIKPVWRHCRSITMLTMHWWYWMECWWWCHCESTKNVWWTRKHVLLRWKIGEIGRNLLVQKFDSSYILTFRLVDQKVVVEHLKKTQHDSCGGSKVQVAVGVVPMEKNVLV